MSIQQSQPESQIQPYVVVVVCGGIECANRLFDFCLYEKRKKEKNIYE